MEQSEPSGTADTGVAWEKLGGDASVKGKGEYAVRCQVSYVFCGEIDRHMCENEEI